MIGRIRTVKPEWLEDDKMIESSPAARVLSVAMILIADDYGRGRGKEERIISRVFPLHHDDGRQAFSELMATGYFSLYVIREQTYFELTNWTRHQRVDKPGKPRVPCRCGLLEKDHECPEKIRENVEMDSESLAPDHDHIPDLVPRPDPDLCREKTIATVESKNPVKRKQAVGDHAAVIARFTDLYSERYETRPTWGAKQGKMVQRLLKAGHSCEEICARMLSMFECPPKWLEEPFDFQTLVLHFDKFVPAPVTGDGYVTSEDLERMADQMEAEGIV